ncbi:zinc-binding dehydrogenase [Galactobacter sp.]|uniref:zinc-binding dehydrogenase n=1 Tax=Galactobacter sp. TaxID=2676125 RepID=UPI0025C5A08B|nr:zinc-binding dehydrogenase [Galactobacter sp.]
MSLDTDRPAPTAAEVTVDATAMVFAGPGLPLESVTVPKLTLRRGEVVVEVELSTVCGSDVHTVRGDRHEPTPLVLGHESVGRVAAVGQDAPVACGDRVVWSVAAHCGHCDRCRRGIPQKCRHLRKYGHQQIQPDWVLSGGFATHMHLVEGTPIVKVPHEIPSAVLAPAGCGIATAWAALGAAERSLDLGRAHVLLSGAGLIGLTACAMARERGARVTVVDPSPGRRYLATRFGADEVLTPDALAQNRSGKHPGPAGDIDVVVEASGSPAAVRTALDVTAVGGCVVLVGSVFPTDPVDVAPERVVRGLLTVTGVHNYAPDDLREATNFLVRHWKDYPFDEFVEATYPLEDLDAALQRAALQREVRVGVTPRVGSAS